MAGNSSAAQAAPSDQDVSTAGGDRLADFRAPAAADLPATDTGEPAPRPAADPAGPAADAIPAAPADAAPVEPPKPAPLRDAAREAIYAASRARRQDVANGEDGQPERLEDFMTPEQRREMYGAFAADIPASGPAEAGSAGQSGAGEGAVDKTAPSPPTVEMVELTVDGEKIYRPKAEVDELGGVRAAQMTIAAQKRLDAAKAASDEARRLLEAARAGTPMHSAATDGGDVDAGHPDHPGARTPSPTRLDKAKLAGIREKIQVGNDEDGDNALQELVNLAVEEAREGIVRDIPKVMAAQSVMDADQQRWNAAIEKSVAAFPDVVEDVDRSQVFVRRMAEEALADFKRIGMSDADLSRLRGNYPLILENYRRLAREVNPDTGKPWGLRPYDDVVIAAGKATRSAFNLPDPAPAATVPAAQGVRQPTSPIIVNRDAREAVKAGLVTQPRAPARGGMGGPATNSGTPPPRTYSDVVKDMRRARGQPVH